MSTGIPLNKLSSMHFKHRFQDVGYSLPFEATCGKTVLQLIADDLERKRNVVHNKKFFAVVNESTLSGIQY